MKFTKWAMVIRSLAVFSFIQIQTAEAEVFLDPRLDAWTQTKETNSAAPEQKRVLVFLKSPGFQNRSGMMPLQALNSERKDSENYVSRLATQLMRPNSQQVVGASSRVDILWASRAFVANITRAELADLSQANEVEGIIENIVVPYLAPIQVAGKNKTDESVYTYGLQKIHAPLAWGKGIDGSGVVVGVIDTGVDLNHPDLKDKIIRYKDFTGTESIEDKIGHGTHVSGTIAGGKESGTSIGVAPGAKIIMAKVFDKKGATTEGLLKAMEWMLDPDENPETNDAPRVVSNSWGAGTQWFYGFKNIVQTWRRFNVFPNFAAGNDGFFFTIGAPGSYPFSFAIGASDENLKVASFSSRGPAIEMKGWMPKFHTKPEVSAPGANTYSSVPGGKYDYYSGTSMATPHVTGVIALALQANPNLMIEDLEKILTSTALDRGSSGKDNRYGFGVIQADQVVEKAKLWQTKNSVMFFQDKDPSQWEWATP